MNRLDVMLFAACPGMLVVRAGGAAILANASGCGGMSDDWHGRYLDGSRFANARRVIVATSPSLALPGYASLALG